MVLRWSLLHSQHIFTRPAPAHSPNTLVPAPQVHDDFNAFAETERGLLRRTDTGCSHGRLGRPPGSAPRCKIALRSLVVLREPYSQLLSEVNWFARDFAPRRGYDPDSNSPLEPEVEPDHFVCSRRALLGLCRPHGPHFRPGETITWRRGPPLALPPACNASSVLTVLRGLDHVGFVDRMDDVWRVLRGWVTTLLPLTPASARNGSVDPRVSVSRTLAHARVLGDAASSRAAADYIRDAELRMEKTAKAIADAHSLGVAAPFEHLYGVNATLALTVRLLRGMPGREEFERRHPCAVEAYRLARREFAPAPPATRDGQNFKKEF